MFSKINLYFSLIFTVFTVCLTKPEFNNNGLISTTFSWDNCGSGEKAKIKTLSISPDPLIIPGDVTVKFTGESTLDAASPLAVKLTVKRKVAFFWIDVPCIDGVGSCEYDDGCKLLNNYFPISEPCPAIFQEYNVPCHCPLPKGEYNIPSYTIDISKDPLPAIFSDGQYRINIKVTSNGIAYACEDFQVRVSSPSVVLLE